MYKKFFLFSALISLLVLSSCSEDIRITKNLYDDWWPVRASGTYESNYYKASWDGNLDKRGGIVVLFVNKTNPSLNYEDTQYYPALSFNKTKETFCYVYIQNRSDVQSSKDLKFYVEDGKIYFEKMKDNGRGSGEYLEGLDIAFQGDNIVKIGNVTYERYSYYKTHASTSDLGPGDRIPIHIQE